MRILLVSLLLVLAGCSPEQSKAIGQQPKKTVDRATTDLDKAMQQGSERMKDEQK
jgi:uncharacterized protein YceK